MFPQQSITPITLPSGVVKMNIDTDMLSAFPRATAAHMFKHYDGVPKVDGEVSSKRAYNSRSYLALAGVATAERENRQ